VDPATARMDLSCHELCTMKPGKYIGFRSRPNFGLLHACAGFRYINQMVNQLTALIEWRIAHIVRLTASCRLLPLSHTFLTWRSEQMRVAILVSGEPVDTPKLSTIILIDQSRLPNKSRCWESFPVAFISQGELVEGNGPSKVWPKRPCPL
jgi:hypothetical protein